MKRHPRILLGLWIGLVLAAAAALLVRGGFPPMTRQLGFWLAACIAGEVLWVRLPMGSATISMGSCFNFAAMLVLPIREALIVAAVATFLAELVLMRKPLIRALYNAAQAALAIAAARACFDFAGGEGLSTLELVSSLRLVPFLLAAVAYYAVNRGAVIVVIALAEQISLAQSWRRNFSSPYDLLATGAAISLGVLLAMHYASIGMIGTLFVALPLLLACDGYRRMSREPRPAVEPASEEKHAA